MWDRWEGVVFDLDGTVVRLRVPWEEVERAVRSELAAAGVDTDGPSVWTLLEDARETGLLDRVEPLINGYEFEGAARSTRLSLADAIPGIDVPVAVCSLNCEAACRRALRAHDLLETVDVVVGRDTVRPWKPDPAPLEEAIDRLDISTSTAMFVGDSPRDARTAEAAGVAFLSVEAALEESRSA